MIFFVKTLLLFSVWYTPEIKLQNVYPTPWVTCSPEQIVDYIRLGADDALINKMCFDNPGG